ncbi:undecaprenyldiphospho-muramoylpentapeptide beta-N-acetylglucosaminyltransferase [Rhizobium sp. 9140]|uniref:undecaprenyldiphospho-muramoylpentapeptide beta-N-acetylglucosaminyltransferase n=1 Tax=Rhizobium sp. 9140 TaxID=1761900 RepID=UPI0007936C15|nr:undecaprenyldiphospho-muramoylpentapeptide beta-N-acetylglucosaminyltransferase [Rhizobium sp. 9140]CZT35621.1 UDP-N-acetylglucosamine-N-acetylmuramylpentapeptide N-acetylglucosamine transferase [Rhizobium sp. 9140]
MTKGIVMLAAGGTGGHLFPAEALAHELAALDFTVHLITDHRAERYAGSFPAEGIHVVRSATIGSRNPVKVASSLWQLWSGMREARTVLKAVKPQVVVGFGGYPTVPPLLAASRLRIPTIIHEQNAVMGRANKGLAGRVTAIAGGFLPETDGRYAKKTVTTGNPVRPAVLEAAEVPYAASGPGEAFRLVVFGGSQGAQFFSKAIPSAVALLEPELRARLHVTQQARPEDLDGARTAMSKFELTAEISPFFTDMAGRIAAAHLLVCRSGASTVSEIAVIGRPSILVPYPFALDHDQSANAAALAETGAARLVPQKDLTPEVLANFIRDAMNNPESMAAMATSAKAAGRPDAARLLAGMVEAIASGQTIAQFKEKRS